MYDFTHQAIRSQLVVKKHMVPWAVSRGNFDVCMIYYNNTTFFARGSIHQGNNRFRDVSRGRQCAFMSLSALLCAN